MDKSFCKQIDEEFLVEEYVSGKLRGELREKFEQHISECEEHANAVSLEKALRRGVREFARSELKSRIRSKVRKREDIRLVVLRFAAFLFVAVITPLILYYQFGVLQQESEQSFVNESKSMESITTTNKMEKEPVQPVKGAHKTVAAVSEKKKVADDLIGGTGTTQESIKPEASDEADAISEAHLPAPDEPETSVYQSVEPARMQSKQRAVGARGVLLSAKEEEPTLMVFAEDGTPQPDIAARISLQLKIYQKDIHDCLRSLLEVKENKEYHLVVEFILRKDGKTQSVKIIKTNIELNDAKTCIEKKIESWTFATGDSEYRVQKIFDSRNKYRN